ncbi:hypothetical protein LEP1GSC043_3697 [Leptospira weilii str. Ecochallenge]|uniref:Uncharacterized protein n=2 Tax=Leptospira weilii TaxID=28184 RepID=N1U266_9LEPT|nr:hypothetical protein LEP1GSC038_0846 [Leptospira weilii str. 2006001855]EMY12236.1 hypothetical protein LEP1GSC043_3697 [Leptospira weilii str. Ecochallenge]
MGIIDPEGILFASKTEDLKANTKITIKIKENAELIGDSSPVDEFFVFTSEFIGKAKRIFPPLSNPALKILSVFQKSPIL